MMHHCVRIVIQKTANEKGGYKYAFPEGRGVDDVCEILVAHGFLRKLDYAEVDDPVVVCVESVKEKTRDPSLFIPRGSYELPEDWDVHQVRELLRDRGFKRTDNRQDSVDDPFPFE